MICATNLLGNDWWNGLSDPYVVVTLITPDGSTQIKYKLVMCASRLCKTAASQQQAGGRGVGSWQLGQSGCFAQLTRCTSV